MCVYVYIYIYRCKPTAPILGKSLAPLNPTPWSP